MTNSKPASKAKPKKERKPQKIATWRLYNAIEAFAQDAKLDDQNTMGDLYKALDAKTVAEARGL